MYLQFNMTCHVYKEFSPLAADWGSGTHENLGSGLLPEMKQDKFPVKGEGCFLKMIETFTCWGFPDKRKTVAASHCSVPESIFNANSLDLGPHDDTIGCF